MKLQFLPAGSTGAPLIRFFDFDSTEAQLLSVALSQLAERQTDTLAIHTLPFITFFEPFELTAMLDDRERNPDTEYSIIAGSTTSSFIWRGTSDEWRNVCELIARFTIQCDINSYEWLNEDLGVQLLM